MSLNDINHKTEITKESKWASPEVAGKLQDKFFFSLFEGPTHYKLVFLVGSSVFKYIICLA